MGGKRHGPAAGDGPGGEARASAIAGSGGGPRSRIHEGLVGARALIGTRYLADPRLRAEYQRDIAPRTVAALSKVLGEIFPAGAGAPTRILDLGAGTGAASEALRRHFGPAPTVVEVDRVATSPTVRIADVTNPEGLGIGGGSFDLVVAAHVLNELFVDDPPDTRLERLSRLVQRWSERLLAEGGTLILLEPALRDTSRVLLAVRDRILAAGLHVVAPCFYTGPCPALVHERDWCHDSATVPVSRRVDFSYLVVRTSGGPSADPALFRVVSDPLVEKGRLRFFMCGGAGRHPVVRLDRNRSDANADLDRVVRGDVVRIGHTAAAGDGLRLDHASTVALLRR